MSDQTAAENQHDQSASGAEVARRTPTDNWLSTQTGVNITDTPEGRMISISRELGNRVNLLVPISQVVQLSPTWTPVPRVVELIKGHDTYVQGRAKNPANQQWEEQHALSAKGLAKIADLMGIQHVQTKWDKPVDGAPGIKATVTAVMRGADGLPVYSVKSKTFRFDDRAEKVVMDAKEKWEKYEQPNWLSAQAKRAEGKDEGSFSRDEKKARDWTPQRERGIVLDDRSTIDQKCETGAYNRCIRDLAKVRTYFESEIARPFLTIGYFMTPNAADPRSMDMVRLQYEQANAALFGTGQTAADAVAALSPPEGPDVPDEEAGLPQLDPEAPLGPHEQIMGATAARGPRVAPPGVDAETGEIDVDDGHQEQGGVFSDGFDDDDAGAFEEPEVIEGTAVEAAGQITLDEAPTEPPMPDEDETIPAGEHKGKALSELVKTEEGRKYLALHIVKLRKAERRELYLAWLSFAVGYPVGPDNLSDFS